jgi:hypothetical protein
MKKFWNIVWWPAETASGIFGDLPDMVYYGIALAFWFFVLRFGWKLINR